VAAGESQRALNGVRIEECGEPLVDFLVACPTLRFAPHHPTFEHTRVTLLRRTVAEMLCRAQALLPEGLTLEIVEGWRSVEVQAMMYRHVYEEFRRRHPDWPEAMLRRQTNRYSAPPDARTPPPHLTGGAVDLHLVDAKGRQLDMWSPYDLYDRRCAAFAARGLSPTARRNRALLAEVLLAVGLTNYAAEWWHWSYGDSGWAVRTGRDTAIYGRIGPPASRRDS
jgi:D-alanyl-D-alanine dipeptidase